MIDYRRITPSDVPAVAHLARAALATAGDLPLQVSAAKIDAAVAFFADTQEHFQMAAFVGGEPVAAVAALVSEMPFHERREAHVCMCFSTLPGAGMRLIRALVAWFRDDFLLRRLVWAMNPGFDARLTRLARRIGFEAACPMFVMMK